MKIDPKILSRLQTFIPKQHGVFTLHDLGNLLSASNSIQLNQKLKPFLKAGFLQRFCRGFYVAREFDFAWLSRRMCPQSAISFGNVLAKEMVIGSVPQKTVYAVKIGKSRTYRSLLGQVVHLGFSNPEEGSNMWFGYDHYENGVCYADKEKAFLDTLYFYQSGQKFSFNVYSDIHLDRLNRKKIMKYLGRYKNPKFRKFVTGVLNG